MSHYRCSSYFFFGIQWFQTAIVQMQHRTISIQDVFMESWQEVSWRHLPCRGLEKLQYDTTEYDMVESDPPIFGVEFGYKELKSNLQSSTK